MRIGIFGLGYVGVVLAACLAKGRHTVIAVDPNATKVDLVNQGNSPVIEKDVQRMIEEASRSGHLRATTDAAEVVRESDIAIVCVGTPSQRNGDLDRTYVRNVCTDIGTVLRALDRFYVVVVRSTVLPGTTRLDAITTLEATSGKRAGTDFGVCFNPEFMREGSAVADFHNPPKIVVAATDERSRSLLQELKPDVDVQVVHTDFEVAEMIKYADNAWHALKIGFANEIGALSKAVGIDGQRVMDIFCQDTTLNISASYLRPGFAFGGSCLPKDLRAVNYLSRSLDLELPILDAILPSNVRHIDRAFELVTELGRRKIGILGLSFKAGTDDLRESPTVTLVEQLLGKGYDIRIFDRNVSLATLMGANRDYILNHIPHISNLIVDTIADVLDHAEVVVVSNHDAAFRAILEQRRAGQIVVDLVRITDKDSDCDAYHGICW